MKILKKINFFFKYILIVSFFILEVGFCIYIIYFLCWGFVWIEFLLVYVYCYKCEFIYVGDIGF